MGVFEVELNAFYIMTTNIWGQEVECDGLHGTPHSKAHMFEYLFPARWNCLGRMRGVSLEVGFGTSLIIPSPFPLFPASCGSRLSSWLLFLC